MDRLKMRLNSLVEICNRLEEGKYVVRKSRNHIRNVPLLLNRKRFGVVGLEHTKDHAQCVLLNVSGKKVASAGFPLDPECGGEARLNHLMEILHDFISLQRGIEVIAIGFADIGIVNSETGTGVYSVHVPDWENVPVKQRLKEEFGLFCRVVDRSGASALDQLRLNPDSEGVRNSLQIFVWNGIGASILQNGRYWGADTPSSCQLGHTIAVPDGERCSCGSRGCVETLATLPAILRRVGKLTKGRIADEETFFRKAAEGNRFCELALKDAGSALGVAIANAVTFTAITNVIVRSAICKASPVFFESIRESVKKNVIYPFSRHVKVSLSRLGEDCSALGAAYYAQSEYFSVSRSD